MADYTNLRGAFEYAKAVRWLQLDTLAENDSHLDENGWQTGTAALFYQAAAPTGWTKVTTAALDGRAVRITGGAGGVTGGGAQMIASPISLAHTHTTPNSTRHTHSFYHSHDQDTAATGSLAFDSYGAYRYGSGDDFVGMQHIGGVGAGSGQSSTATGTISTDQETVDHSHNLATTLTTVSLAYIDCILCQKDTSSGYTDMTNAFYSGKEIGNNSAQDFINLAANDAWAKTRLVPAGSVMVFGQAASPSGWTKAITQNNKGIRIVTGTGGGAGGTAGLGDTISFAHNSHTVSTDGSHNHPVANHSHQWDPYGFANSWDGGVTGGITVGAGGVLKYRPAGSSETQRVKNHTDTDGATTSDYGTSSHSHVIQSGGSDVVLAYQDVIQCSKNAYDDSEYTDMTAFFAPDNLLAWQDLEALASNDEYLNNNQIPDGSVCFFYNSTPPSTWTQILTSADRALRIVSGTGGGTGGSSMMSTGIVLSHTHPIVSASHTHGVPAHAHTLTTEDDFDLGAEQAGGFSGSSILYRTKAGASTLGLVKNTFSGGSGTTGSVSHDHGGATNAGGTNVTLAYADVLMCSKDA